MNKQRRQTISKIIDLLDNVKSKLEEVLGDEELSFESMPENLQGSLRGEESEEAIEVLSDVVDTINECIDNLNDII